MTDDGTVQAGRWQVRQQRPVAYDVIKAPRLFHPQNTTLLGYGRTENARRLVVIDAHVARLHGAHVQDWFARHGIRTHLVILPAGETHKTIDAYQEVLHSLNDFPIHRRDEPIIAIGGGVLTDVAAFVAASYRRGVPHLKIPTTLMGYVDAALGIKNGVNFEGYKNRLGSFEPPLAVLLDKTFLQTLPRRHLLNGLCEIIKLAVVCDVTLLTLLETHGAASIADHFASDAGDRILDRAIGGMLAELEPNLYEETLERRVDFGHTFSYGLETRHANRLLHGEAVLLDVLVSCLIAQRRGLLSGSEVTRVFALVAALGMRPDPFVLDVEGMWQSLLERIDHRNGQQRVPMPAGLGRCTFLNDITRHELEAAIPATAARLLAPAAGTSPDAGAVDDRIQNSVHSS